MMHRRGLILGGVGLAASPSFAADRRLTPAQTEGPFYPPPSVIRAQDADLVRIGTDDAPALGRVAHVLGRAVTPQGRPLAGARVEIWQCDANGRYLHPGDTGRRTRDPRFQGFGRAETDAQGRFRFRTIKPVAYDGRTPHIHLALFVGGQRRLTTQMYVAGEPHNARDFVLAGLDAVDRAALVRPFVDGSSIERGALMAQYDLVVRG